ncbi:hypothetical protein K7432_000670 [Basidiobolus ranarum]|uniref:Calcineurin-like phosphoesterase domain-containing protein n=1 Tax=Basidiobolus ranarum TaxID=34480 RepID=A0ABR2WAU1_9FUNG
MSNYSRSLRRSLLVGFAVFLSIFLSVIYLSYERSPLIFEYHHNTTGRLIFIGDVHGHLNSLDKLLEKLRLKPEDQVILLGDMVSKGPDSIGTIARAKEINALCVRGNHEELVIRWKNCYKRNCNIGYINKEHQRIASALPPELYEYLVNCPLIIHIPEHSVYAVHAGLNPYRPINQQNPYYIMNIRRLLANRQPAKDNKEGTPWSTVWNAMQSTLPHPKTVLYGHESSRGLAVLPYAIGLDSGCGRNKWLTAVVYPQREFVSVKC